MLTKQNLALAVFEAVKKLGIDASPESLNRIAIDYPDTSFGDYTTNAALMLAKDAKANPRELAQRIIDNLQADYFDKMEIAGPGFINFFVKKDFLLAETSVLAAQGIVSHPKRDGKILLEYFQPNIAKPLHIGHIRTAVIGDAIRRSFEFLGHQVESDTHMGDWGTQFGNIIAAYKMESDQQKAKHMISNVHASVMSYIVFSAQAEKDTNLKDRGRAEFKALEDGDEENIKLWKHLVEISKPTFLGFAKEFGILSFEHHWPESFYTDKMPTVLDKLKARGLMKESQGAQIVDLSASGGEDTKDLGIAVIVKSDGGTTYLLRDLATFIYRKSLGFEKQLYVVDSRQSHAFRQLFVILKMLGEMSEGEGEHIDYGFIGFKGEVLSTRKGNMVLAEDVINQAKEKVAAIIQKKNPDLKHKAKVIDAVAKGALKYYDLSHNRKSDYDFDWDEALDFEGSSGPYLQYVYARLSGILAKEKKPAKFDGLVEVTETERQIMVELTKLTDVAEGVIKEYQPNVLASYLYNLAGLVNKFYHESPVIKETDEDKKHFRLNLITATRTVYGKGLDLLGITALDEM